jgi:CDP-glucose 4,6-dehydratase
VHGRPLYGYVLYAEDLAAGRSVPRALNFGPPASEAVPVQDLVAFAAGEWERLTGFAPDVPRVVPRPALVETQDLTLDASLAAESLRWDRLWGWQEAITRTLDWYVRADRSESPRALVLEQVDAYLGA